MSVVFAIIIAALGASFADLMDGCILVKAAVVSATGGNPKRWGITFASVHCLIGFLGVLISSSAFNASHLWGDVISIAAVTFLLVRLSSHMRSCPDHKHSPHCNHIEHISNKESFVFWTALALSSDAIAMGAMLRGVLEQFGLAAILTACAIEAAIVGSLIAAFSTIGEGLINKIQQGRIISRVPIALLFISLCYLCDEVLGEFVSLSLAAHTSLILIYVLLGICFLSKIDGKQRPGTFRPLPNTPTRLV